MTDTAGYQSVLDRLNQFDVSGAVQAYLRASATADGRVSADDDLLQIILRNYSQDYEAGFRAGEKLIAARPDHYLAHFHFARSCIATGRWKRALWHFDLARNVSAFGSPKIPTTTPLWNGECLSGKTLLLACEGGFGDAICFSRFARSFKERGARVILAAYEPIFETLESIAGIDVLMDRRICHQSRFDYWLPFLSSPRLLDLDWNEICGVPYLRCSDSQRHKWQSLMPSKKLKVGVCWQGNPGFVEDHARSIPGELFAPLLEIPGYQFYKVQVNQENSAFKHAHLTDLTTHVDGPNDVAGFIQQLDLMISVDSAQAHIAGAMGIPTLLLNRVMGWFVFSLSPNSNHPQHSPWYDSMWILHQKKWGDWQETIHRAAQLLTARKFPAAGKLPS